MDELVIDGDFLTGWDVANCEEAYPKPPIHHPLKGAKTEGLKGSAWVDGREATTGADLLGLRIGFAGVVDKACPVALGTGVDKVLWTKRHEVVMHSLRLLVLPDTTTKFRKVDNLTSVLHDEGTSVMQKTMLIFLYTETGKLLFRVACLLA